MSTLVAESLSVSGILLGKTMGRSPELADRFRGESERLADLEVRSRMTGRWVMASIQTSFAIMPALVYWFAGWSIAGGGEAITIGTLVAFTTLQTRLFFPIGQLLSVGVDVQTSLALFDRVFEYLDLPVEIAERDDAVELEDVRGDVALRGRLVPLRRGRRPGRCATSTWRCPAGTRTAIVGETGAGKTTLGYLVARLYEPERGRVTIDGVDVRDASFASLAATVGVVSQETYLFHASVRENLRFARPGRDRRGDRGRRARRAHPRPDRVAARRLRHGRRRARLPLQRRREAAHRDRAHGAAQPAGADPRRGHELTRHRAPSAPCRRRSTGSPRAARRSRSPTACRRSATPTRSSWSTAAGSPSAARTTS